MRQHNYNPLVKALGIGETCFIAVNVSIFFPDGPVKNRTEYIHPGVKYVFFADFTHGRSTGMVDVVPLDRAASVITRNAH